jgi:hypothetical protein
MPTTCCPCRSPRRTYCCGDKLWQRGWGLIQLRYNLQRLGEFLPIALCKLVQEVFGPVDGY